MLCPYSNPGAGLSETAMPVRLFVRGRGTAERMPCEEAVAGGVEFGLTRGATTVAIAGLRCISLPFAPRMGFGALGMMDGSAVFTGSTYTFTWEAD